MTFVMVGGGKLKVTNTSLPSSPHSSHQEGAAGEWVWPPAGKCFLAACKKQKVLIEPTDMVFQNLSC